MPKESPEIQRAIEMLEEVVALRGRSGADVDLRLAQIRAAMRELGVDSDVVTDILYPPPLPEPADPALLPRLLRRRLDDLGYSADELSGPELTPLPREELDRRIEQAIRNASESFSGRAARDES
jgi:hypothetical protein